MLTLLLAILSIAFWVVVAYFTVAIVRDEFSKPDWEK
jgi:hypothetical protein